VKNAPSGKRTLRKDLAAHPEVAIIWVLFVLATVIERQELGALGYLQIWGISLGLGALWVVIRPRYFQEGLPSDVVMKSVFLLGTGAGIIFAEWLRAEFSAMRLFLLSSEALESEPVEVTPWISIVGGLTGVAGLAGLVLCRRVSAAFHNRSATFIRACAAVVALVAVLLIVIATMAGAQLIGLGPDGG
jgi:hypothetical protein